MWRYERRPTERHFSADARGCESLLELFGLMRQSRWPSRRSVPLVRPSITSDWGDAAPPRSFAVTLAIGFDGGAPADRWELAEHAPGELRLGLGRESLAKLVEAVSDVRSGRGDYSIGGADPLWVWWWAG